MAKLDMGLRAVLEARTEAGYERYAALPAVEQAALDDAYPRVVEKIETVTLAEADAMLAAWPPAPGEPCWPDGMALMTRLAGLRTGSWDAFLKLPQWVRDWYMAREWEAGIEREQALVVDAAFAAHLIEHLLPQGWMLAQNQLGHHLRDLGRPLPREFF